jgi:hypothetical protein
MRKATQILLSTPFILVGAVLMGYGGLGLWKAAMSKGWPTVPGKVISSKVEADPGKGGTVYSPDVDYSYTVNGTAFISDRLTFGRVNTGNPAPAQVVVGKYPVDREVTVFYSPKDPTLAVLEPGIHGATWPMAIIGLFFFAVGIFAALQKKKPRIYRRRDTSEGATHV